MEHRLHLVVGDSVRLRDEAVAAVLQGWSGPVSRTVEPADLARILLDLDTASFLNDPTAWVVRADERYLKKVQPQLVELVGRSGIQGWVVVVTPGIDARDKLVKALTAQGTLHRVESPGPREVAGWLIGRLQALAEGVQRPGEVSQELLAHVGEEPDALLAALEVAMLHAGSEPVTVADVRAVCSGVAERPIWEFTGALLDGQASRALELLHAGGGMDPQPALSALTAEVRKLIACTETSDDAAASTWAGAKGRGNLYYARKRARELGRSTLLRLLQGMIQAQRQLRRTGVDTHLVLETLILNAQRVVRPR